MRIIPLICAILVVAGAAPNPGSYSSANHYQFQRSSSSYRNNELQHKDEEAGAYGRIEDPDKYDKPLEQSHYRQSSYRAPGTPTNDDEEPAAIGIKGGRPNSYLGHSANFHRGYFGHDTNDDSTHQFGGYHHPPGFRQYGGQHEGHGYHHNYHHHHREEASSQSSVSTFSTNQNKDDQMISLDQTFDYSKFKDQGFGKEYLENTEGQRVTTPRLSIVSTTENIRPIFETTEEIPEQPAFSSQMGNNGRTIQQNSQQGQGQISQHAQQEDLSVFGINSQQGQQQEHVVHEDQISTGVFGSGAQMEDQDDNQQQIDIGQSFLQGETTQNGQSNFGQNTEQGQTNIGQVSTQSTGQVLQQGSTGQVLQQGQSSTGFTGQEQSSTGFTGQVHRQGQSSTGFTGQVFQQGSTGQISQQGSTGQVFQQGQSSTGFTGQVLQQGQTTNGQTLQAGSQTVQEHLKPIYDQIDQINRDHQHSGSSTDQFNYPTYHHNYNFGGGRHYDSNHHHEGIHHHTTGYIKPKYESGVDEPVCVHTHEQKPTIDWAKMEVASHHKEEKAEEKAQEAMVEETVQEEKVEEKGAEEMTTEQSVQEATTEVSQQENNNMEMVNQQNQNEMSQGNLETMTEMEPTTTEHYYHQKQEKDHFIVDYTDGDEDLTQQTQHFDHHHDYQQSYGHHGYQQSNDKLWKDEYDGQQQEDLTQHFDHQYPQSHDKLWKDEYEGQQQEDLTQQTQDAFGRIEFDGQGKDLTQQQEDGWAQFGHHEDLTQKQEQPDDSYGHLEFGAQQREDLSQKSEDFGTYYGQNQEQFATEVQDVSQQVQKVQNLNLEAEKEPALEPEEIVVTETTQKPGFWRRLGGSISRTYETAKEKVKNNLG